MGIIFSSPQLPNGVRTTISSPYPFTESYGFDAANTNSFGVSATITRSNYRGATPVALFPSADGLQATITCAPIPFATGIDDSNPDNIFVTTATVYTGSVLCDHPNSEIAPGTATLRFIWQNFLGAFNGVSSFQTLTYSTTHYFVVATESGTTTTTRTDEIECTATTSTATVPSTEFFTPTTILTGASSTTTLGCSSSIHSPSSSLVASSASSGSTSPSSAPLSLSLMSLGTSSSVAIPSSSVVEPSPPVAVPSSSVVESSSSLTQAGQKSQSRFTTYPIGPATRSAAATSSVANDDTQQSSRPLPRPTRVSHGPSPAGNTASSHAYISEAPHKHGHACRRKTRPTTSVLPHGLYRREEGYSGPDTTFESFVLDVASTEVCTTTVSVDGTTTSGVTTLTVDPRRSR